LVVSNNQKFLLRKSSTSLDISNSNLQSFDFLYGDTHLLSFTTKTALGDFVASNSDRTFTYNGSSTLTGNIVLKVEGSYQNFDDTEILALYISTTSGSSDFYIFPLYTSSPMANFSAEINYNATFNTGDILNVIIIKLGTSAFYVDVDSCSLTIGTSSSNPVPVNLNESIIINDTLPKNILQKDFISSIVKLFNLYVFEDYDNDKKLRIKPFVDFYANATAVDWSMKIDRSKPIRVKPMSELNSRYFEFNYKDDSDYYNDLYKKRYNKTYGSFKYDSEFEFANESTKVELIFSGTPLVGYTGEDKVYSTIFKRNGDVVGVGEENIDSNIRILQTKVVTGVTSWGIKDGSTVLGSQTQYIYAGHFDDPDVPTNDLNFGVPDELFFELTTGLINVNQFNVYWSSYLAEITDKDSRLLIATAKLEYKDIYQLDFSKLIYIDGNLYRLNKIEDFNATDPDTCKVEFLKIINRIY
jgi:hypothetical protein